MGWNGSPDEDERKAKLKLLHANGLETHQIHRYDLLNGQRDLDGIIRLCSLGVPLYQLNQFDMLRPGLDTSSIVDILEFGIPLEKIKSLIDQGGNLKRFAGRIARGKTCLVGDGGTVLSRGIAGMNIGRLAGRPRPSPHSRARTCEF